MAQHRLAAGQTDLACAQRDKDFRQSGDLLEGQHFALRQELVVAAKNFLGHAVHAAEIAAVGDRDAQIAERPAHRVFWGGVVLDIAHLNNKRGCPVGILLRIV